MKIREGEGKESVSDDASTVAVTETLIHQNVKTLTLKQYNINSKMVKTVSPICHLWQQNSSEGNMWPNWNGSTGKFGDIVWWN